MITKTDRERYYERPVGRGFAFMVLHAMEDQRNVEDIKDGLKAFCQAWFSTYEDETDLPPAFWSFLRVAEDVLYEDLGFHDADTEDEDDE